MPSSSRAFAWVAFIVAAVTATSVVAADVVAMHHGIGAVRFMRRLDGRMLVLQRAGPDVTGAQMHEPPHWIVESTATGDIRAAWSSGHWPRNVIIPGAPAWAATADGGVVLGLSQIEPGTATADDITDATIVWTDDELRARHGVRIVLPGTADYCVDVEPTADGGVLAAIISAGATTDGLLLRLDAAGAILWGLRFVDHPVRCIASGSPGDHVIVLWGGLLRVGDSGTVSNEVMFTDSFRVDEAWVAADGGVALAGIGSTGLADDLVVARLDSSFAVTWATALLATTSGPIVGACPAPDGSIVVASTTQHGTVTGPDDALLAAFAPDGTVAWQRALIEDIQFGLDVMPHGQDFAVAGVAMAPEGWPGTWIGTVDARGVPTSPCVTSVATSFRTRPAPIGTLARSFAPVSATAPTVADTEPIATALPRWSSMGGDAFEMADGCPSSGLLRPGVAQARNFCDDAWDLVRIDALAGETYVVETAGLGVSADTVVELLAADCTTVVASDDDGGGGRASRLSWTAPGTSSVTVRIRQSDATFGPGREYELRLSQGISATSRWLWTLTGRGGYALDAAAVADGVVLGTIHGVAKVGMDGSPAWAVDGVEARSLATDGTGGVIAGGLGGVTALDDGGNVRWQSRVGSLSPTAIRPMRAGGVVAAGEMDGSLGLAHVRADGTVAWATSLDVQGTPNAVVEHDDGTISMAAVTRGVDPLGLRSVVARFDATGALSWLAGIDGEPTAWRRETRSVLAAGNDVVVSQVVYDRAWGVHPSAYVVRLDAMGGLVWSRRLVGLGWIDLALERGRAGSLDIAGSGVCGGAGDADAFVAHLAPDGSVTSSTAFDLAQQTETTTVLSMRSDGSYYLGGWLQNVLSLWNGENWVGLIGRDDSMGAACRRIQPASLSSIDWPSIVTLPPISWRRLTLSVTATVPSITPGFLGEIYDVCGGIGPPREVSPPGSAWPLLFSGTRLWWEPAVHNGADVFNVYRGDVGALPSLDYGACWRATVALPETTETESPPPGTAWFYLVAAENPAGEGPLGSSSLGRRRTVAAPCP